MGAPALVDDRGAAVGVDECAEVRAQLRAGGGPRPRWSGEGLFGEEALRQRESGARVRRVRVSVEGSRAVAMASIA